MAENLSLLIAIGTFNLDQVRAVRTEFVKQNGYGLRQDMRTLQEGWRDLEVYALLQTEEEVSEELVCELESKMLKNILGDPEKGPACIVEAVLWGPDTRHASSDFDWIIDEGKVKLHAFIRKGEDGSSWIEYDR